MIHWRFYFCTFCCLLCPLLLKGNSSVYFNEDSIDFKIINCIDKAKKSVQVCVFIYEWKPIADALISAKKKRSFCICYYRYSINFIENERS